MIIISPGNGIYSWKMHVHYQGRRWRGRESWTRCGEWLIWDTELGIEESEGVVEGEGVDGRGELGGEFQRVGIEK